MLECLTGAVGPKAEKRWVEGEDGENEDFSLGGIAVALSELIQYKTLICSKAEAVLCAFGL